MSDSEGAEGIGVNSDGDQAGSPAPCNADQDTLPANGLQQRWTYTGVAECEDSDEQTGNFQQRDASEEDMDDTDIEEAAEASGSGETLVDAQRYSSSSGRKKVYASEEHNRKERMRRKELKNAVDELRKQLRKPTKKASTISILKAAQEEIQELEANKNKDEGTLEDLKQIHGHLQLRLERLKMELQDKPTVPMAPSFPQMSPSSLSQLTLQPPPRPQPFPHMLADGGRSLPLAPQHMILVGHGGLQPSSLMVPPPLPPSLVSIPGLQPAHNSFLSHTPCPALIAPYLPPLQPVDSSALRRLAAGVSNMSHGPPFLSPDRPPPEPCVFTPAHLPISLLCPPPPGISGLVGHAQIPQMSTLGGVGPSAGVFASLNSWTNNPANQRPYFPVTVFSHPPTSTAATPPCPPLSSSAVALSASSQHPPHPLSSQLSAPTSVEATAQKSGHCSSPSSLSTAITHHDARFLPTPSSRQQRPPSPPAPSHATTGNSRMSSRGTARKHAHSVDGNAFSLTSSPLHRHQEPLNNNGSHSTPGGVVAGRARRETSSSNEDKTDDEDVAYSQEKRVRREFCGSSSDSDSGGSCFSDQGLMREATRIRPSRRSGRKAAPRSNSSKRGSGKSGRKQCTDGKMSGRSVPLLCSVDKGCSECVGSSSKEAVRRCGPSGKGPSDAVRESSTGQNLVVSLTSHYHVSTDVETGRCEERVPLSTRPPPLDSRPTTTTARDEAPNKSAWGKNDASSTWMDEIVERSVNNFRNKFMELSATTAS